MKKNSIELVTQFDEVGNVIETQVFFTRPNISLSLVYECVDYLENLDNKNVDYQMLADIVSRIYDSQFSNQQLLNGLQSYEGYKLLMDQIIFVATGNTVDSSDISKDQQEEVSSWGELKNNLRSMIKEAVKKGDKDINDVLNTPFYFFVQELNEESKVVKKEESMIDAFM
ncbi:hypothetical protein Q1L93_00105 [Mammaliicoccus sciuri]|uniref:phage tail assembly chaperone GT n=1 Tax=Mammaliicoccus sciuri TaxID=1296 RepID=UPI00265BCA21|nr:hypothetical protein [Mammaliicoccus sciuri]MDO0950193.1 hypothetical protein [Mammaliicoccus sciuri]